MKLHTLAVLSFSLLEGRVIQQNTSEGEMVGGMGVGERRAEDWYLQRNLWMEGRWDGSGTKGELL